MTHKVHYIYCSDCEVDYRVVQHCLVGHDLIPAEDVVNRTEPDKEQVDEQVVERKDIAKNFVTKTLLDPESQLSFESVNVVCKSSDSRLYGLVVLVNEGLESIHYQINRNMPFVPLFLDFSQ